jgi:hypothetical protein
MDNPDQETTGVEGTHPPSQGDLADELRKLGNNIKTILATLWESEERKKVQREVETGLNSFGSSLNQAANDFQKSDAGQRLKDDIDQISEQIRRGEIEARVRTNILSALKVVNEELQKAANKAASTSEPKDKQE